MQDCITVWTPYSERTRFLFFGEFAKTKGVNVTRQEIQEYLKFLRQVITKEALEITRQNMQLYVAGPAKVSMKLFLLWNENKSTSKTIYPDVKEARVWYKLDLPSKFKDIKTQYKAWYEYVTTEL